MRLDALVTLVGYAAENVRDGRDHLTASRQGGEHGPLWDAIR